jgi:hypothetical protein
MQIQSTSGAGAAASVQNTAPQRHQSSIPPAPNASPAATKNVSPGGDLMSKLAKLQQQDPAKFKEVVSQIATDVKAAAGKATGEQATELNKIADNFSQAATTGSLQSMQPAGGGPGAAHHKGGHRGHHGMGGAGSVMQSIVQGAIGQVDKALSAATPAAPAAPAATTAAK